MLTALAPATTRAAAAAGRSSPLLRRSAPRCARRLPPAVAAAAARCGFATHEVFNQATPLEDVNLYTADAPLQNAVAAFGGDWAEDVLTECGALYGASETITWATQANTHPPQLKTHDRFGHRIDSVEFHPAYHHLMTLGKTQQLPSFAWNPQPVAAPNATAPTSSPPPQQQRFAHTARAALPYMGNQIEAGTMCPLTMTYASVPALRHCDAVAADWVPGVVQPVYDPRDIPAPEKAGLTVGMSMTEKQGGSDVRSNTTVAKPLDPARRGSGDTYSLRGHKWFTSAPHCDAFLTLAYAEGGAEGAGPSCFLVPRWLPDGTRNAGFQLQRLKDKLGDRSNASSEVEYQGAHGRLIGREGRGVKCIIEMVTLTRLDCTIGSAALMRQALSQALHHTAHRSAFGARLADQPLMRNVLADLALESEAAALLTFRSARGIDDAQHAASTGAAGGDGGSAAGALSRLLTAVAKYFVCKAAPRAVYEAMECHGGNGFVEESGLPRLFRQSPLNAIWEGSSNIICLDILRTMLREPVAVDLFLDEVNQVKGADSVLDAFLQTLEGNVRFAAANPRDAEASMRVVADQMGLAISAAVMVQHALPADAAAYIQTRIGAQAHMVHNFGTLPVGGSLGAAGGLSPAHVEAMLDRALLKQR